MNKINYQKKLDALIEEVVRSGTVPTLLLHSCCAPCSSYVLKYLSDYFRITLLYFNPNISPKEEYIKRVGEQKRLISELPVRNPVSCRAVRAVLSVQTEFLRLRIFKRRR